VLFSITSDCLVLIRTLDGMSLSPPLPTKGLYIIYEPIDGVDHLIYYVNVLQASMTSLSFNGPVQARCGLLRRLRARARER
jgi:hypothetical protein